MTTPADTGLTTAGADLVRRFGGRVDTHDGHPRWWIADPGPDATDAAEAAGWTTTRRVHQMRRPLPLPAELTGGTLDPAATREFDPATDTDRWLAVNNAAFAWHPDQGGWTRDDLDRRRAEPWFDAAGFRVLDDGADLAGFCWTKVHPAAPDDGEPVARGEIYVIAVAPSHTGRGLGRALTVAGLDWLWQHRRTPMAMLYVEHDNAAALATYRGLGFTVHSTDVAFEPAVTS